MSTATITSAQQPVSGRKALSGLASLAINFAAPLVAYKLIQPHVDSSALAMALAGAIPAVYTLAVLAVRRKLNVLGVIGMVTFGIGILASWACGGNTLAMELQDPALTGAFGLVCLGSVAIGRPLHRTILRLLGRSNPRYDAIASRAATKSSMITTAIIGLAFLGHAAALTVMALTESTGTFVALQQPVGLSFFGVGIGGLFLYHQRQQARQHAATANQADANQADANQADANQADANQGDERA